MTNTTALILDLGDVLFSWQPPKESRLSLKTLKRAMSTMPWQEFERGRISEEECYSQIATSMSVSASHIADTIRASKSNLQPRVDVVAMLREIKEIYKSSIKIYIMSNISKPHWDYVRSQPFEWELFDGVFVSAEAGFRKPDLCFYKFVLNSIGLLNAPERGLFMDDKLANVTSAQALGMQAFVFDNAPNACKQVQNVLGNSVGRGKAYLEINSGDLRTTVITAGGQEMDLKENFTQLLILEATGDRGLVRLKDSALMWNYFQEQPLLTTSVFPNDFDTTSLALSVLGDKYSAAVVHRALDMCLTNLSVDGLPMVYEDRNRPRVDPIVCLNVYLLFHIHGRSQQLTPTWQFICMFLENRAYEHGTYYYTSPDWFLYSVARLITYSRKHQATLPAMVDASGFKSFLELFRTRCQEHINKGPSNALDLAVRIIACRTAGIPASDIEFDTQRLKELQDIDGGWPWCEIYKVPSADAGVGSRGVVTALAIKALKMLEEIEDVGSDSGCATTPWRFAGFRFESLLCIWPNLHSITASQHLLSTSVTTPALVGTVTALAAFCAVLVPMRWNR